MEWNRSKTLVLASMKCPACTGLGMYKGQPCDCVTRAIFRTCWGRFRDCSGKDKGGPVAVNLERLGKTAAKGPLNRTAFGWPSFEYLADFYLIAKRTLTEAEWDIFRFHYLLGANPELCQRCLRISKEDLQDACKRIEVALGRAFGETEPFGLYPLDEYFSPKPHGSKTVAFPGTKAARYQPLRPPLAA